MAKLERTIHGDFDEILQRIDNRVLHENASSSLEACSDFRKGTARCSVRVYERYSISGSNRVSLSVTLFQVDEEEVLVSAIASGGSQAVLFKINTWGEEAFLNVVRDVLTWYD